MSQEAFEAFAIHQHNDGVDIRMLVLKKVPCHGQERDFILSTDVWARSILKQSKRLHKLYLCVCLSVRIRQEQLEKLKNDYKDLYLRIT